MKTFIIIIGVVIIGLIIVPQVAYTVDQTDQAIITRFGEVKAVKTSPGLYIKAPFLDTKTVYDRRVLGIIDTDPVAMPDIDKQNLVIDSYTRYRIVDPVQFRKTFQTETNARSRLGDIVTAALRAEIANSKREQIIGGKIIEEPGLPPRVEPTESRSEILERVLASVRKTIAEQRESFGIEIIDVRIKGADFPESVAASIFVRMRAERNRIASGFRAEGDKQDREIRADVDRRRDITLAEAEKQSNILRGEGEARAIRIFAAALEEDREFYSFRRSLDAYRTFLNQQTTIILSSESDLFRFLQSPLPASGPSSDRTPAPARVRPEGQSASSDSTQPRR